MKNHPHRLPGQSRSGRLLLLLHFVLGLLLLAATSYPSLANCVGCGGVTKWPCPTPGTITQNGGYWYYGNNVQAYTVTYYLGNCTMGQYCYAQSTPGGPFLQTDYDEYPAGCIGCPAEQNGYQAVEWAHYELAVLQANGPTVTVQTPVTIGGHLLFNLDNLTTIATVTNDVAAGGTFTISHSLPVGSAVAVAVFNPSGRIDAFHPFRTTADGIVPLPYTRSFGDNTNVPMLSTSMALVGNGVTKGIVQRRDLSVVLIEGTTQLDQPAPILTLTCASNKTIMCDPPCALTFDPPTVTSTCCGGDNVLLTVLSTVTNGTSPLSVTRTWEATDCCTNTATCRQTVTVIDPQDLPVITQQPQSRTVTLGQTVSLTVVATGAPPLAYQWRFIADVEGGDVATLVGETNATLTIANVQTNHAGRYDVVVSNPFHSVTSAPASLFMVPYAELILDEARHVENSGCCWEFDFWQHWGAPGNIAYIDLVVTTPGVTITSVAGPSPGPGSQAAVLLTSTSARWYMPAPNGLWNAGQTVTACFAGIPAGGADLVFRGYDAQGNTSTGNAAEALEQSTTIGGNGECACPPLVILKPLNATRYTCLSSAKVCYYASASGGCPPYTFTYSTPPCSTFATGTMTPVTATVTDSKGNTASTTFTVKVLPAPNFWQWFAGGNPNCYMPPYVMPYRSACLNGAYAGPWKSFDIPTVNRRFGLTWNLPYGLYNGGYLYARMKDFYCVGGPQDDTIRLGLQNCSPLWDWSKPLSSFRSPWCMVPQCGPLMVLNLGALPAGGGNNNVLPSINATYPRRLDMMVEDDTRVDFAWLRMLRCPPQYMIGGIGLNLTNAELAQGPGTWTLVKDAAATNGFTATLELGAAQGVRLNFEQLNFASAPGGSLRILDAQDDRNIVSLVANTNGSVRLQLGQPFAGVSNVVVLTLSNSVVVASNTLPAAAGVELANFPAATPVQSLSVDANGSLFVVLGDAAHSAISVRLFQEVPPAVAAASFASVTLAAEGFNSITLGQPELRWIDPADGQHDDWFATISGNAVAWVAHDQLTLSALDAESAEPMGFTASLATPTNAIRATIATSIDMVAPVSAQARLSLGTAIIGDGDDDHDSGDRDNVLKLDFNHAGSLGWELTVSASNALSQVELFHNGNSIATITNPASVQVAGLPSVYAPSLKWMKGGICHGLLYSETVSVQIDGVNYMASEVRVMTAGNGPAPAALGGIHVETTGIEALVLSRIATGPMRYRMEPPVVADGNIIIQGNPMGGAIQSAPVITGPWTTVPDSTGEIVIPLTNSPAQYFRIKGN